MDKHAYRLMLRNMTESYLASKGGKSLGLKIIMYEKSPTKKYRYYVTFETDTEIRKSLHALLQDTGAMVFSTDYFEVTPKTVRFAEKVQPEILSLLCKHFNVKSILLVNIFEEYTRNDLEILVDNAICELRSG